MPAASDRPRDHHVAFFLSTEDAAQLALLAEAIGCRNRGSFCTWIIENLLEDQFAPIAGARVCLQILKAMKKSDMPVGVDFRLLIPRKLPPFPEVTLTEGDINQAIRQLELLKKTLKPKEKP